MDNWKHIRQVLFMRIMTSLIFLMSVITGVPVFAEEKTDPVVKECLSAIEKQDFEAIERLRDKIRKQHVPAIASTWKSTFPWGKKDAYITLMMDQQNDILTPMMEDGLNSPTPETRAYALMILKKDFTLNKVFWDSRGWVIPAKVDAAVREYKTRKKK
ncbi:MAG: hypothetical protein JNM27_05010 [Leptospirales bacterium]|nr:hypothetical protein [Leptospirales bacterium]